MKKNYNRVLNFFFLLTTFSGFNAGLFAQNAGVNATGATPNSSSILDLNTGNTFTSPNGKGLLIPNVSLNTTADNTTVPVAAAQQSMLVYNSNNGITGTGAAGKGYYWWDNTSSLWINLMDNLLPTPAWLITGNSGTAVATNFLGTTDNVDLAFRTNNLRSGLINIAQLQTFYGHQAGLNTGAATHNSFFGAYSGLNTTGAANSFFGGQCGQTNTSGAANTAMGYFALLFNSTGSNNTALGAQTLYNTTGSNNTAVGINTGFSINTGTNNTAVGYYAMNNAGASNISGSNNTAIGASAGIVLTTGNYNTALGFLANASAGTFTNSTAIGSYAQSGATDALILGSISGTNGAPNSSKVGIGTTTPSHALVVKVPAAVSYDAIYADVTAGDGTGNAVEGISAGKVGYSTMYASNTPVATAGTGFDITLSHHAIGAQVNLPAVTPSYAFAIHGEVSGHSNPCGAVLGYYSPAAVWGALGYRNIAGTANYGVYSTTAFTSGAGRAASGEQQGMGIGIGSCGDVFGGWIRGNVYGMAVKGDKVSLYVDGKTIVNQPIIQLTKTADDKTIVNYTPVSATADLQLHGVAQMEKGSVSINIDETTLSQFASIDDLTIIVTPGGQTNGVYAQLQNGQLIIKENNSGTSSSKVSWIIIGKRNIDANYVPEELKDKDFDNNLRAIMHNENDKTVESSKIWWDGAKLNKGTVSPK